MHLKLGLPFSLVSQLAMECDRRLLTLATCHVPAVLSQLKGPQANFEMKQLNYKEIGSHKNNTKHQKTFKFQQPIYKVTPHGEDSTKGETEFFTFSIFTEQSRILIFHGSL